MMVLFADPENKTSEKAPLESYNLNDEMVYRGRSTPTVFAHYLIWGGGGRSGNGFYEATPSFDKIPQP